MPRCDEDALSWDGDDDPTLDTGTAAATDESASDPASLPDGWTPVGRGSASVSHSAPAGHTPPPLPAPDTDGVATGTAARTSQTDTSAAEEAPPEASENRTPSGDEPEPAGLGTAALVSIGVLGGVYLLFAIGWLVGGLRLQGRYQVLVTDSMYQGALWLATAAPLIWFATTLFATRKTRSWVRWLWLAFGVLLLIPWPFLMIGAVGR
ncbi:DNA polymerase III subunit gamma/tau [Microbacterium sp.]|jgi:hypothetical protein|uniref:DNA polymerase III subunit gamma/tau n=1 Tax=Microbacterium sp. TaxID=51671 RepID=UPI0037C93F93